MTGKKLNFVLDEIVSIKDIGEIDTYDFSIPETNCFVANGVLVHNSLEEAADLVFLLHWNYQYTKKEIEKNDYDILVAKNRNGKTGAHKLHYSPEYYKFSEVPEEQEEK